MTRPDDTQPRSPIKTPSRVPAAQVELEDGEQRRSGGCLAWGLIGAAALIFAFVIMGLSAVAGWTSGQRLAQANATATQSFQISEQMSRLPGDINSGNTVLVQARIQYLATLTPGVGGLNELLQTATAVYLTRQPTLAPTATMTFAVVETAPTAESQAFLTGDANALDLPMLLDDARSAIALRDWDAAIDALDVILRADAAFESNTARRLMSQALTEKALGLFRSGDVGDLAEAILLADRAEEYGDIGELAYERYIAGLYLDAINSIGINFPAAIQALSALYNQVPNYRDVGQQLFNQYLAYGDAWAAQSEYCPAAIQYQNALNLVNDPGASAKLNNAQTVCAQATPVGLPVTTPLPGTPQPIAPIGVPGT